jgi:hypothetical protein
VTLLLWLLLLPLRLPLALLKGLWVFLMALLFGGIIREDDAAADGGRRGFLQHRHPERHLQTPAIGRRGWRR